MWALIVIQLVVLQNEVDVKANYVSEFKTVEECFQMRDKIILKWGRYDGYPPPNHQAVCVRRERLKK